MTRTVMGERTMQTKAALMAEAERRVRGGEPLAHVAHALQVSGSTIGRWAARGLFRLKDLAREADGLPPLPVPAWARPDYCPPGERRRAAVHPATGTATDPARLPPTDLAGEAAALAREALALVRAGRVKSADDKLRAADRLLRIQKRLGPAEKTVATTGYSEKAQAARDRVFAMSEAELMAEIKRIAAEAGRI